MDQHSFHCIQEAISHTDIQVCSKPNLMMLCADARKALRAIPDACVDAIITSPPYANVKNYGTAGQVGHGQTLDQYYADIENILLEALRVTKDGGALWLVLDSVKIQGQMAGIPWQISILAQKAGWILHDAVVWDKGKSLPWSGHGKFRNVCEHILLLSKGKLKNFNLDSVRDSEHLSSYWVKYPERYHPDGKAPSDLWHFPIPNQGSWSPSQSRHFCPFPVGLVARMVNLSTSHGDVILDPFSGTGSVAAVASFLGRFGVGIELNPQFVDEFDATGFTTISKQCANEMPEQGITGHSLRQTIVALRMLKYPRTLYSQIAKEDALGNEARSAVSGFWVKSVCVTLDTPDSGDNVEGDKLGCIDLKVLLSLDANYNDVSQAVNRKIKIQPLSIYGIQAHVQIVHFDVWNEPDYFGSPSRESWFVYRKAVFNIFDEEVSSTNLATCIKTDAADSKLKVPTICAPICLNVQVPVS